MKKLIGKEHKQLLYRDKIKDEFLLLKHMEVFRKSNTTLGCYCWSYKIYSQLKKTGIIFNEWKTDDRLYTFEVDNANLHRLIATGSQIRRCSKNGRWLRDKEKRLAHKIYRYNPKFK